MNRSRIAIITFCILSALIPFLSVDMPRNVTYAPSIIALIFYGGYSYFFGEARAFSKRTMWLTLTIFGVAALSLLWAKSFDVSLKQVTKLALLLSPQILLLSLIKSLKKEQLQQHIYFFSIGVIVALLFASFEILNGGLVFNFVRGDAIDTLVHRHEFNRGITMLTLYSLSAVIFLKTRFNGESIKHRTAPLLLIIPLLITLFLTESQSAQLAFLVGVLFLFAFPYKSKIAWLGLRVIIPALILISPFLVSYIYQNYAVDIQKMPMMTKAVAGHRLEIWDYVSRYALQNPLFGHGIEVTRTVTDFQSGHIFKPHNTVLHPHNFVFQTWIEFGLFGALIVAGFLYTALTKIQKEFTPTQARILLTTMMATLVPCAFAYGMWQGWWIGFLFHLCAISLLAVKMVGNEG